MKTMFIFIEGPDDERFLQFIYGKGQVHFIQYRKNTQKDINSKLRSIRHCDLYDYLFFVDADGCNIADRIERTIAKYHDCEADKIRVVQYEIESWYLAGIKEDVSHKMKIKHFDCTDSVRKEQFKAIIPKRYSRVDFMAELLKRYDIQEAQAKNASFKLFYDRWKEEQAV